eukprot:CAMPEP_0195059476 /NCGR_PEP_ID=MMETSP0448-20130528/6967_1 /TAXON_ID=66468 /ORGANISM="Heterocapsa triquestra, Strain CCMP 448" /LENGTH=190 /DNA_ID=CAMNT_0040089759 /DNA_START=1 /DNA_END=573 /DNA_ORIENTATION=-
MAPRPFAAAVAVRAAPRCSWGRRLLCACAALALAAECCGFAASALSGEQPAFALGRARPSRVPRVARRVLIDEEPDDKTIETMRKFSVQYAKVTDTRFCSDLSVSGVVVMGLAHHKETLGAPLCPCRHYEDKQAEAKDGYWNCPCVPMRERHECHCMLFLEKDNPFACESHTDLKLEDIIALKQGNADAE